MSELRVQSLHIHPVKSTRAQSVGSLILGPDGAEGDRRYMVIDDKSNALTARDIPKLVLVKADIVDGGLHLTAPGMPDLLTGSTSTHPGEVKLWSTSVEELVASEEASSWFSDYLETSCQLVHVIGASMRKGDRPVIPQAFQDAGPILVISASNINDLNARLDQAVTMAHFRPNIVIEGSSPFDEDCWARFRIGDVVFEGLWCCDRCVFTTIDPETGEKLKKGEPLRELAKFRKGNDNQVYFGLNAHTKSPGTIHTGDAVEILERRDGLMSQADYRKIFVTG